MFERKTSFGKLFLTFALGAATGAAVALLYAPMTGRKMQKRVGDVTDKVIDATGKMLDKVEDRVEDAQGFVKKIARA